MSPDETARIRREESRQAANLLGAEYHESIGYDLEIFYDGSTLKTMAAIMRQVAPQIVLTHALSDYMEDHMNTARLAVTAAFALGIPNFPVKPPCPAIDQSIAVYHAQPFMNQDPLGQPVRPRVYIDVSDVATSKRELLACHASQRDWLDVSQGLDSYLETSHKLDTQVGGWSKRFMMAEGWTQHAATGLGSPGWDPLTELLPASCWKKVEGSQRD